MEVDLLAPCSAKPPATAHSGPRLKLRVAFWRQEEQKVLFSETILPPPLPRGDIRPHSLESPLTQEGQVIPLQISSQVGRPVPRRFLGEALWQQ